MKRQPLSQLLICILFCLLSIGCGSGSSEQASHPHPGILGEAITKDGSTDASAQTAWQDSALEASLPSPDPDLEATLPSPDPAGAASAVLSPSDYAGETLQGPSVSPTPSVTLAMVGDILLHTPVEKSALREDGTYSYDAIFTNTRDLIRSADLALVNQEVILGGKDLGISGYPAFNAPYELGDDLVEAGFDMICHATNHALDKGKTGLLNCLGFWESTYPEIRVLGIHDQPEDPLTIYEKDGIRIAFLNYTYSTNGVPLPEDMPYAVDMLTWSNQGEIIRDIQLAEAEADFTVVCPHWGTEYRLTPDSSQEKWNRLFLENGVDLVLGTHPHVIEPVELLTDESTGHSMLVYYSLGNFVNWTSSSGEGIANRMVGGMAQVTLVRNDAGEVEISDYGIRALVCHLEEGTDGVSVELLSDYNEEKAASNAIIGQDPAFSYEYCVDLCNRVWGELWE